MMALLALLLASPPPPTVVADRMIRVNAAKNAWFTIPVIEKPAIVECSYIVKSGSTVRAVLLEAHQAMLYNQGKAHTPISATPWPRFAAKAPPQASK